LRIAKKNDICYSEFLTRLLRAQWHHRQKSALEWRIKRAKLPESKSLASLPFHTPARRQPQAGPHPDIRRHSEVQLGKIPAAQHKRHMNVVACVVACHTDPDAGENQNGHRKQFRDAD
jgi:hypothetical protein